MNLEFVTLDPINNGPYLTEVLKILKDMNAIDADIKNLDNIKFEITKERAPDDKQVKTIGHVFDITGIDHYTVYVNALGRIEAVTKLYTAKNIEGFKFKGYNLHKNGVFKLNENSLFIKRNYPYQTACPFSYGSEIRDIIYIPQYNILNLHAMVITTESLLTFAYIDPDNNILYASSIVLLTPVRLSLDGKDVETFKSGHTCIYEIKDASFYNFITDGDTVSLKAKNKFKALYLWFLQEGITEAKISKNLKTAILLREKHNLVFTYDTICDYALLGRIDMAIETLLKIESFLTDWEAIREDKSLDNLRSDGRFISLLNRHL